mgnify:CR=1 FL=1
MKMMKNPRPFLMAVAAMALCGALASCAPATSEGAGAEGANDGQTYSEYSLLATHEANGMPLDPSAELAEETCTPCHADYIEVTADYNNCYNPHGDHDGIHFPNVKCSRCHSLTEDPVNWCTTCHNGLVLSEGWQSLPLM